MMLIMKNSSSMPMFRVCTPDSYTSLVWHIFLAFQEESDLSQLCLHKSHVLKKTLKQCFDLG
jgi:hypothetical protein